MSSRLVRSFLFLAAMTVGLLSLHFGIAGAASADALLGPQLRATDTPALLTPITESGRTGWTCKPEHAASAKGSREAELPAAPGQPE